MAHAHSCDLDRGVLTQFLFYNRNFLYCNLFPGEILTDPEKQTRQPNGSPPRPLY